MADFDLPPMRDWKAPALDAYAAAGLFYRDARLSDAISHARGRLVYLATPYSKIVVDGDGGWHVGASLDAGARAAGWAKVLACEGVTAVSPVVQAVEMVQADLLSDMIDPLDAVFWERWCRPLLEACNVVIVPPIAGWDESDRIWGEVCSALGRNCPVFVIRETVVGAP